MNTKSKIFGVVIDRNDTLNSLVITHDMIKSYLDNSDYVDYYAFILHDKDTTETGELKYEHYHIVIRCINAYSKETILNDFAKHLVKNRNIVSVRAKTDLTEAVQYLTHETIENKNHYSRNDIITSNYDLSNEMLESPNTISDLTVQDIIEIVKCADNLTQCYIAVGLKNAKLYRNVIKDIYDTKKGKI